MELTITGTDGGQITGNSCHCSRTISPSGHLPVAQHSWGSSAPTYAIGQSAFLCKKEKQGWKWEGCTYTWKPSGITFPTLRVHFSCQRGQMLSWIKWFTPNHHQDLHGRKADGSCKCMWKLSIKAGESQYRKAPGCKALTGIVPSLFCLFAGELQNVPVRVRWPCQSDVFITKEFIHKKSTQLRPHD